MVLHIDTPLGLARQDWEAATLGQATYDWSVHHSHTYPVEIGGVELIAEENVNWNGYNVAIMVTDSPDGKLNFYEAHAHGDRPKIARHRCMIQIAAQIDKVYKNL